MSERLNLRGQTFGQLKVIKFAFLKQRSANGFGSWWLCKCSCGSKKAILGTRLTTGHTKSCGCARDHWRNKAKKHGLRRRGIFTVEYSLWHSAKRRAQQSKIKFAIEPTDILVPKTCPLLGIPLQTNRNKRGRNSPSLDRIEPTQGYTPDNVWVISWRANRAKSDLTINEMKTMLKNFDKYILEREAA